MNTKIILSWVFRLLAAIIFLQTLYFKFSGAPESIYIFSTLGIEPWGRIGTGIAELVIGILLIIPRTAWIGALGGLAIISGAILAHLTQLGIEIQGDGGKVFYLAIIVFISCLLVSYLHRAEIDTFLKNLQKGKLRLIV